MLAGVALTAKPVGDGTMTGKKGWAGPLKPKSKGAPKPGGPPANAPSGSTANPVANRAAVLHAFRVALRKKAGFKPTGQCYLLDEGVKFGGNFADVLRSKGLNVRSVEEIFGKDNDPGDPTILDLASNLGARVITADRGTKGGGFGKLAINIPGNVRTASDALKILKSKGVIR